MILIEGIKKPYSAPEFELVQVKLDNVLNDVTSYEAPIVDVEQDMDDDYGSGADGN